MMLRRGRAIPQQGVAHVVFGQFQCKGSEVGPLAQKVEPQRTGAPGVLQLTRLVAEPLLPQVVQDLSWVICGVTKPGRQRGKGGLFKLAGEAAQCEFDRINQPDQVAQPGAQRPRIPCREGQRGSAGQCHSPFTQCDACLPQVGVELQLRGAGAASHPAGQAAQPRGRLCQPTLKIRELPVALRRLAPLPLGQHVRFFTAAGDLLHQPGDKGAAGVDAAPPGLPVLQQIGLHLLGLQVGPSEQVVVQAHVVVFHPHTVPAALPGRVEQFAPARQALSCRCGFHQGTKVCFVLQPLSLDHGGGGAGAGVQAGAPPRQHPEVVGVQLPALQLLGLDRFARWGGRRMVHKTQVRSPMVMAQMPQHALRHLMGEMLQLARRAAAHRAQPDRNHSRLGGQAAAAGNRCCGGTHLQGHPPSQSGFGIRRVVHEGPAPERASALRSLRRAAQSRGVRLPLGSGVAA